MGWFSLLPDHYYLSTYEKWIAQIFLFIGLLFIGPWILLLIYDFLLYLWRTAVYELPFFGGRSRGKQRPRAPSLRERPSGDRRRFSLGTTSSPQNLNNVMPYDVKYPADGVDAGHKRDSYHDE